ncbi:sterol desaturase family protein [Agaribacter flavus]|uniref:Sterol desaturase family protein n=1 Tax=Agaribacter flavus TaxID=1902781 RepID=A0ABV7FM38_9ALTE
MSSTQIFFDTAVGTAMWIGRNITFEVPWSQNYFWGLTLLSLVVWLLEITFPWRKHQRRFRHDFWLDAFYMYFNFFIFSIVISGVYAVLAFKFSQANIDMQSLTLIDIQDWPLAIQLLVFFVLLDFLQWLTHLSLHRINLLWRFHQVHHSIKEMGFAGHLRYHWMENVLYKPLKTLGIMLLGGFEPEQAFIVHFFTIAIGHLNHANIKLSYGPFKYLLNNSIMHLYHHAYDLPKNRQYGMNFGLTLSIWDYIFGTAYVPEDSGDLKIGYKGDEKMPTSFAKQLIHGFYSK